MSRGQYDPDAEVEVHGYGGYSRGCKCDVCRAGKAERMRELRAEAVLRRQSDLVVPGARHGTYAGYKNDMCRCPACSNARRDRERERAAR
jgi:hypothetical protein